MQVKDLISQLQKVRPDAFVVVGSDVIHDIGFRKGRIETGYYNPIFVSDEKGKEYAVVFMANTELSTGEVVSVPK